MFFNSVKEINRLRKETNRLLSKGMPNIHLKVNIETFSKLRFSGLKKFVTRSVFGELRLTQLISLNFKTSCCNLKIKGLGTKLCQKSKRPCILLNKNINFNKNETESKIKNPAHTVLKRRASCFSSCKNRTLKVKL